MSALAPFARWASWRARSGARRPVHEPDAADLGTAFGMELSLEVMAQEASSLEPHRPAAEPRRPLSPRARAWWRRWWARGRRRAA